MASPPCEQVHFAALPDNPSAATEAFAAVTSAECVPKARRGTRGGTPRSITFHGWRVVAAAFVIAVFGWGIGFYGPPVFLSVVRETRGWPLILISTAVTVHFLIGAVVGANLPTLYRRLGAAAVTKLGALCLAAGLSGWAVATAPWQLFVASVLSGAGWGGMSAAAINAIVSPWFVRRRPAALAMAYNGGSVGGVIFSPLWLAAIEALGFTVAAAAVGLVMAITTWVLASLLLSHPARDGAGTGQRSPRRSMHNPDPIADGVAVAARAALERPQVPELAAGMALGLFAQIGLTAHLFSLLVPALGAQNAGLAMGLVTAMAIAGRTLLGWNTAADCGPAAGGVRRLRRAVRGLARVRRGSWNTVRRCCCSQSCCSGRASAMPPRCRR